MDNHEIQNDTAILEKSSAYFLLRMIKRELFPVWKGEFFSSQEDSGNTTSIRKWEQYLIAHYNYLLPEFDSSKNLKNMSKTVGMGWGWEGPTWAVKAYLYCFSSLNLSVTTLSRKSTGTSTWAETGARWVLKATGHHYCSIWGSAHWWQECGDDLSYLKELWVSLHRNSFHRKWQRQQKWNSKCLPLQDCHYPCWN